MSKILSYITKPASGEKIYFEVLVPENIESVTSQLPVVLFQHGYGSNSVSHGFVLQAIASAGYVVVAPNRTDDFFCGTCGVVGFLSTCSCSAMATDGTSLMKALEFIKKKDNQWMEKADLEKISIMGFSMGGQEVIHMQARAADEVKAIIILSGSVMLPLATVIGWNPCCQPCAGGTCTLCSDTPVGLCGMPQAVRKWSVPSLFITSDFDAVKAGTYKLADIAGGNDKTLVTFKDSALDLSFTNSKKTTSWGLFSYIACYGMPFYGIPQHFALGGGEDAVTSVPIVAFLNKTFNGSDMESAIDTSKLYQEALNTKSPNYCCSPFPLFASCCEC